MQDKTRYRRLDEKVICVKADQMGTSGNDDGIGNSDAENGTSATAG
jgi:hypothetical protein